MFAIKLLPCVLPLLVHISPERSPSHRTDVHPFSYYVYTTFNT